MNVLLLLAVLSLSLAGAVDETVETVFILDAAHTSAPVGAILLAVMAGGLLAGPVATRVVGGQWLRVKPQLLVGGALALEAVGIVAAGLWFSPQLACLVAGVLGFAGALFWSVFLALLPDLVSEDQLLRVNKWISFARNSGFALGPFAGSFLYATSGVSMLVFIGVVTALLAVLCLLATRRATRLNPEDSEETPAQPEEPPATLLASTRRLATSPSQGTLLAAVLLIVGIVAVANVLSVSHITLTRGLDDRVFGLYNGMISIGLVLGPLILVDRLRRFPSRSVVFVVLLLWALAVAAFAVSTAAWQLLIIGLAIGLLNGTMVPFYVSQLMAFSKEAPEGKALLPAYMFCANAATALGYVLAVALPPANSEVILLLGGIAAFVAVALCWLATKGAPSNTNKAA